MSHREPSQTIVTTYEVKELLKLARQGRIRLPKFQRPPRWKAPHVVELFDSLRQGYPIGTLLFGERPADEGPVEFGAFQTDAPARRDALWVVDGQQRLNALLGTLLHPDEAPRGDIHAIWFDLLEHKFVHVRRTPPPVSVPLRALGDPQTTLRWADAWSLRKQRGDLVDEVFELAARLTEFSVSAAVVREGDEGALREIFRRMNNAGVTMKEGEIFDALFGHLSQGKLKPQAARVSAAGYGAINEQTFLRSLLAVEGLDPGTTVEKLDPKQVQAMSTRTEAALRATFRFLSTEAEVPHLALLPYVSSPLRVLARYFARFSAPSPRALTLLRRWFWRGCVSRQFASASQGIVRRLQKCIEAASAEEAAQNLLADQQPGALHFEPAYGLPWRVRNADCRIVALALLDRSPLDPRSGVPFTADDIAQLLRGGADEEDSAEDGSEATEGRSLSELCVDVTGTGSGPLVRRVLLRDGAPEGWWATATRETLDSHLLLEGCVAALQGWRVAADEAARAARLDAFDAARAERLRDAVSDFLDERCGTDADDSPSITEILRSADLRMHTP